MTFPTAEDKMELKEVKNDLIFKNPRIGDYYIGYEISFGVHLPTHDRKQAESIMQQILSEHEIVERLKRINIFELIDAKIYLIVESMMSLKHYPSNTLQEFNKKRTDELIEFRDYLKSILENKK